MFGAVYMNELAWLARRIDEITFPTGATIVREKMLSANDLTPQALAVMIKREKGFNPEAGDWEFLVVNGLGNRIEKRQKQGDCVTCHSSGISNDYVFARSP